MSEYSYCLKISDICVKIISEIPAKTEKAFLPFLAEDGQESGYLVDVRLVPQLMIPKGSCMYQGLGVSVWKTEDDDYIRIMQEYHEENRMYAVSSFDWERKIITVNILEERKQHAESILEIFKCIAWETVLINENRLMLHASFIRSPYGGIAFSGPSGIGKTTQASLWCRHGNAELLNGDKILLKREGQGWKGYGSPYAGSSNCHVNDECELRYLFFLKQGEACGLRKVSMAECFKQLYAGCTLNHWDAEYMHKACELMELLAAELPIYELTCTPDVCAVEYLQKQLKEGLLENRFL